MQRGWNKSVIKKVCGQVTYLVIVNDKGIKCMILSDLNIWKHTQYVKTEETVLSFHGFSLITGQYKSSVLKIHKARIWNSFYLSEVHYEALITMLSKGTNKTVNVYYTQKDSKECKIKTDN